MAMNRKDIYKEILLDIYKKAKDADLISEDEYDDAEDDINSYTFSSIDTSKLRGCYQTFAASIKDWDGANDDVITSSTHIYLANVAADNICYFKQLFCQTSAGSFAVVTTKQLFDNVANSEGDKFLKKAELIWPIIYQDNAQKVRFWDLCTNNNDNGYYILTDEILNNEDEYWNAYSFGYLLYVNEHGFEKHVSIDFTPSTQYSTTLSFQKANKYYQYYELYNLISESHYCNDILRRYLVMYQIIENMCYRRHLAKISEGDKRAFVRKSIALANKGFDKETEEIINGFAELFPHADLAITAVEIQPFATALTDNYGISGNHNNKKIGKIIYNIRNSIVHNKATELHFAYGNVSDYSILVPLIKLLINRIEPMVIEILNDPTKIMLDYDKKVMYLY